VTEIEFEKLGETTHVTIEVFDITGNTVIKLFDKDALSGVTYKIQFDGSELAPAYTYIKLPMVMESRMADRADEIILSGLALLKHS